MASVDVVVVSFCENRLRLKACFCCNIVIFQDICTWCQEVSFLKNFSKTFPAHKDIFQVSNRNLWLKTLVKS